MRVDENYFKDIDTGEELTSIEDMLDDNEQIIWKGKPNRKSYILSNFLKMMPIALIWLAFDSVFIIGIFSSGMDIGWGILFFIGFFALHLMPVWIWIGNFIRSIVEIKNIEYAITEKKVIIKTGIIGIDFKIFLYSEITGVNIKRGIIDNFFKVGDIYINTTSQKGVIYDIDNPYKIYKMLQQVANDIKTDIYYPNSLRPEENNGYNTKRKFLK